jgi:dTDP-4-dehydrorhamnose 3,5-epimerase
VQVRPLAVPDAFEFTPTVHADPRGAFLEMFRADVLADTVGHRLHLEQSNCSVSSRGSLRGIHFADVPPGQAKYVTCVSGAGLDVVVDLRVGSPTFGAWDTVLLDERDRRAVYVAEGLGHAFLALTDGATLVYLCSEGYRPEHEHAVNALDPELGIGWPADVDPVLSPKDAAAPGLQSARESGLLPRYDDCRTFYDELRRPVDG